jgi:putative hemolysin
MLDARETLLYPDKPFKSLLRPPLYIPETATVESLMKNFRSKNLNVALVVDEYGNVVGIVSVRDIAERVVGEIQEEDEAPSEPVRQIGPRQYVLAGSLNVKDWAGMFDVEFDRTGVYTLGGFVTAILGRIPAEGDVADYGNIHLIVLRTKGHRVTEVALEMAEENTLHKEGQ